MQSKDMQSNNTGRLASNFNAQQSNDNEIERSMRREHNDKMRIATLNVGTLEKKYDELFKAMEEHRLDILCLQETGEGSNDYKEIRNSYKVYYSGGNGRNSGVAVCVKKKWQDSIDASAIVRITGRIIAIKLVTKSRIFNIISVYAPHQNRTRELAPFWERLGQITDTIPPDEVLIVAGDFNGHVGADREGFDMWHGGYSIGDRNEPGQKILEFARVQNLALVNTFFTNEPTYESGNSQTVTDYLTIRRDSIGVIDGCEVIRTRSLATQHKLVLMDLKLQRTKTLKWTQKIINWWKLNTSEGEELLRQLRRMLKEQRATSWSETYKAIICRARETLVETELGNCLNNESWWWDDDVQQALENREIIDTIASNRPTISSNLSVSPFNKSHDEQFIKRTWKDYFDTLLNSKSGIVIEQENEIHDEIEAITESEVKEQIKSMEIRKKRDLNHIPIMLVKKLGDESITWLLSFLQYAIENGIPDMWKQTKITPQLKQNRHPHECKDYYGIHSSNDFIALLEGILKKRLQELTEIQEKSTTDSVFCIRMFQERQREFKKPLHMILIKLDNACNTTPSEGVWNCLRRKNVPEKYISLIKDMYSHYKARVVTSVGETDKFQLNLNLHRGSVLSKLILAIVLNVTIDALKRKFPDEYKWTFPWAMMHGDCIVLSDFEVTKLQNRLGQFERIYKDVVGLKLHQMEIEYISPTSLEGSIQLQNGITIESCASFTFLQTTIQREGGCEKEVERKISKAWRKWHKIKGFLCDESFPLTIKTIIYEKVIRRVLLNDCETWPISEKEMEKIDKCEMRMLKYYLDAGDEGADDIVRKRLNITAVQIIMRARRLLWYGKVMRNELPEEVGMIFGWKVQDGNRGRGRPKRRWMDSINKDIKHLGTNVTQDDAMNKEQWETLVKTKLCNPKY